jgi:hypothetical protein
VKRKNSLLTVTVALAAVLAVAGPACAQMHSSELPPLTLEGPYPRVSEAVAGTLGFPDHLH